VPSSLISGAWVEEAPASLAGNGGNILLSSDVTGKAGGKDEAGSTTGIEIPTGALSSM
jgi:hypothetical protein